MISVLFLAGSVIYVLVDAARTTSPGGSGSTTTVQCNDHLDNDADGFCDYARKGASCSDGSTPGDPQCVSKNDTTEADSCTTNWQCSDWSACLDGTQTRTCTDANNCGSSNGKPSEAQSCITPAPPPPPPSSTTTPAPPPAPSAALDFSKVVSFLKSHVIFTKAPGMDLDANGRKEFMVRDFTTYSDVTTLRIYENTADNIYASVYTQPIDAGSFSSYYPADTGDNDGDGKQELLVFGRTGNNFYVRVYEKTAADYPDSKVWETPTGWWTTDAYYADLDKDGKKEIVFGGQDFNNENKIQVFENSGDNSYGKVFESTLADVHTSQSFVVFDDIDGDSKQEMAFCGLTSGGTNLYLFENAGDNAYSRVWSADIRDADGQPVNCSNIVYAGDMDKDGRKEFAVGGHKTAPDLTYPQLNVWFVYEATSDNIFQKIYTLSKPTTIFGDDALAVGDLNGDGDKELIIASENSSNVDQVSVWDSSGDNQFTESWTHVWSRPDTVAQWLQWLGIGDHDGDGKAEIIFNEYNGSVSTSVYERTP